MAPKRARAYRDETAADKAKADKAKAFAKKIGARHRTDKQKAEAFAAKVGALRATCEPLGVRLLSKAEVLAVVNVTYPALWKWMRDGSFPRSRLVGNKSMWLSTDIAAWLTKLPPCRLKGDAPSDDQQIKESEHA
jgi:predicted DNA-binding transcriptional regulator AlpA